MRTDRSSNPLPDISASDAELMAMTTQLDELHRDQSMPAMQAATDQWCEIVRQERVEVDRLHRRTTSRRTFLLGTAGAATGGLVRTACSSSSSKPSSSGKLSSATLSDLSVAAMASSLENLGVYAYTAGIQAAVAGEFGKVPVAVPVFAITARDQHVAHGKAWNALLTAAGEAPITATDTALTPAVNTAFGQLTGLGGLLALANYIELIAAQTYQEGVAVLHEPAAVGVAATIHPVEMQHSAILYFALGQYPGVQGTDANKYASGVPLAFSPVTLARPPSDIGGKL